MLVTCPQFFLSHGCDLICEHDGDHLCLEVTSDFDGSGEWCTFGLAPTGTQWMDWCVVCYREPQGSPNCFTLADIRHSRGEDHLI